MRIDAVGITVEEGLDHIVTIGVVEGLTQIGVALVERLADLVGLAAGQFQAHPVVAHQLAPELVEGLLVGCPGGLLAIKLKRILAGKGKDVLLEQVAGVLGALQCALLEHAVQIERRLQVAGADGVIELGVQVRELGQIVGAQVDLVEIQSLEVALIDVSGAGVVEGHALIGITGFGEDVVQQARGVALVLGRLHRCIATGRLTGGGRCTLIGLGLSQPEIHCLGCGPKRYRHGNERAEYGSLDLHGVWMSFE